MNRKKSRAYDLRLYDKNKIFMASKAYMKFCSVDITEKNEFLVCEFTSESMSVDLIMNEFDNYVIELMQCHFSS